MSVIAAARRIEDLGSVQYPEGIRSPSTELNANAQDSKFKYDRDFLLQFMKICTEKPDMLPPLDAIGLQPSDQTLYSMTYGAVPASLQASTGLNFNQWSGFNKASPVNTFNSMGQFATLGAAKMLSEDRFAMSSHSASGPAGSSLDLEPVAHLQQSANSRKALAAEIVDRKVKGLLNKLTIEKFDSISDQIIEWANRSEREKDGRTLIQVIRLVVEKATDEATWSEMYARLCRKMMEQISTKVQDDGIKNAEGKPITGGHLFRKYLLNRCQEDFERDWVAKEATAAAAASKALEDKAAKEANDKAKENAKEGESTDEVALYSEEYYAAQKAKRQGLGLMKFIGELFKLQMLTERIMHECVKKLLGNVDNPEEEEIESLCKLLSIVGQLLDTPRARAHMDVYFSRMKDLIKSPNVSSRMQFMLQDVIELRERRWVSYNQATTSLAAYEMESGPPKSSRPSSYKGSATLIHSGVPDGRRRRLKKPIDVGEFFDADEFFNVRNLDEAEVYFSGLPSMWHHERLVETLVSKAIESKEADATLVADFFTRAASKGLCSPTSFEEGFLGIAESLGEIVIDAPKAWDFMALMVKGAHLDGDRRGRIASKTGDAARLLRLLPSQKAIADLSPFKAVPDGQLRPLGLFPSRVSPPGYHEAPSPSRPHMPTSTSYDDNRAASSASHSPLAAAHFIVDLGSIQYPDSIQGPNMELNINTPDGKFRYDREFLLQFMKICTYRPDSLPPLDAIGLQSFEQTLYAEPMNWGGSFQNQTSDAFRPVSGSVGPGFRRKSGLSNHGPANLFTATLAGTKTSSDNKVQGNRVYTGSQGTPDYNSSASARSSVGLEAVTPLQRSANGWDRKGGDPTKRKVRGLLNKLTEKTFDSVSSQIIMWANKLHDGHDHRRIIQMIYETLDDRMWLTRLLAHMCEKMQSSMPSTRSQDFCEGLFQRCTAGFKRHWESKDGTAKDDDPKAKRQALGLLSFMGQLFVLQMLGKGDAICLYMETLLGGERKLEGLCTLLRTAGRMLDDHRSRQLRGRIDACFSIMEELCHHASISPRICFMLQVRCHYDARGQMASNRRALKYLYI
ncbi:ARM repeat-containing protein [Pleurotus eryngii]|uniref:ARM repeat-containing protein n=1 Tax=Pleurotus eryngii TaxID=5323 RepID=A0A9P6A877_PLEER|nr:ARM repeat-containing protein [Pleurotus eryngii]